ncbi:MAG: hypothetical protein K9J12_10640 [Melioribacteraceae bacterium]|nr:hypothetical protein [Melioribacteraceae bacterium]
MKKIFFLFLLISLNLSAQEIGYVETGHGVYKFLDRMDVLKIIEGYNSFELPKTRKSVSKYLGMVIEKKHKLNSNDNEYLDELIVEFEADLFGTITNAEKIISEKGVSFADSYWENEKYVYFLKENEFSFYTNLQFETGFIHSTSDEFSDKSYSGLYKFGGNVRGTVNHNFGFSLFGTNGSFFGSKPLAKSSKELKYHSKFILKEFPNTNTDFYDQAEGFITADFGYINFKLGNDRNLIGYGREKIILGDYSASMDYFSTSINYKFFSFTAIHGGLSNGFNLLNPRTGENIKIDDKFLAYHRFALNLGDDWSIGAGEMAIYSNRSVDFAYLNPFNFYKNAEHTGDGLDNTLLFYDFSNQSIAGLKIYGQLMFDDLRFGKIGTSWFGNQSLLNLVVFTTPFLNSFPLDIELQYLRIDPYFYAHRSVANNYANGEYPLGSVIPPNSQHLNLAIYYRFTGRLKTFAEFTFTEHADNEYGSNGELLVNHGGDLFYDRLLEDSYEAPFLSGKLEYRKSIMLNFEYEFLNNYYADLVLMYTDDKGVIDNREEFRTHFTIRFKL